MHTFAGAARGAAHSLHRQWRLYRIGKDSNGQKRRGKREMRTRTVSARLDAENTNAVQMHTDPVLTPRRHDHAIKGQRPPYL